MSAKTFDSNKTTCSFVDFGAQGGDQKAFAANCMCWIQANIRALLVCQDCENSEHVTTDTSEV